MSRFMAATLLLIVLVDNLCESRELPLFTELIPAGFTEREIKSCRCKYVAKGKIKCFQPLIPANKKVKPLLIDCLCKQKRNQCPQVPELCSNTCPKTYRASTPL